MQTNNAPLGSETLSPRTKEKTKYQLGNASIWVAVYENDIDKLDVKYFMLDNNFKNMDMLMEYIIKDKKKIMIFIIK